MERIHPLLRAYCQVDENYDVWFIINETQEMPLEVAERNSDDQWKAVIQKEYRIPFDFEKGPLIRFVLLKSDEISDLLIYCQHVICDGLSLAHLAEEILFFMNEPNRKVEIEANVVLPIPENFLMAPKQNKLMALVKRVIISNIANRWKKSCLGFGQDDFLAYPV